MDRLVEIRSIGLLQLSVALGDKAAKVFKFFLDCVLGCLRMQLVFYGLSPTGTAFMARETTQIRPK